MKKILSTLLLLLALAGNSFLFAQNATWLNGVNTTDDVSVYGTLGVEAATNKPGSRREFVTWKDNNGNLWMFGGFGRAASSITGHLSDLWKYNASNNQWTWVSGPNTRNQQAVYGTQNVSAPTNRPGSRRWATGWADASGNLWLFGGFGYAATATTGRLNDLWKYNIASNEWTWVSGANVISQTGDYTTAGSLRPGARQRSCSWFDGTDGWIFGGDGFSSTTAGGLNDLWRYNTTSNTWSFIAGNDAVNTAGVYGTLGVPDVANKPGSREYAMSWYDANKLYLFGGGVGTISYYNDLWTYDLTSGQWTWIKGDNTTNNTGVYGSLSTINPANNPGGRELSVLMKDPQGRVFLFGGQGYSATTVGYLNDIWCYRPLDNTWTWVGGTNVVDNQGVYGTQGLYAATNKIGGRYGAGGWTDAAGNMIIFGGFGMSSTASAGYLNDLWYYNAAAVLPITLESFSAVTVGQTNQLHWTISNELNNDYFTVLHSTDGVSFQEIGRVRSLGNTTEKRTYDFSHTNPDMNVSNYYQLKQTDLDGKSSLSEVVKISKDKVQGLAVEAWMNSTNQLEISASSLNGFNYNLFNLNGQLVMSGKSTGAQLTLDVSSLLKGIYVLQVRNGSQVESVKLMIH